MNATWRIVQIAIFRIIIQFLWNWFFFCFFFCFDFMDEILPINISHLTEPNETTLSNGLCRLKTRRMNHFNVWFALEMSLLRISGLNFYQMLWFIVKLTESWVLWFNTELMLCCPEMSMFNMVLTLYKYITWLFDCSQPKMMRLAFCSKCCMCSWHFRCFRIRAIHCVCIHIVRDATTKFN